MPGIKCRTGIFDRLKMVKKLKQVRAVFMECDNLLNKITHLFRMF